MDDDIRQFLQKLNHTSSVEEAFGLLCQCLHSAGYEEVLFTFLPESYQQLKLPFGVACMHRSSLESPLIKRLSAPDYLTSSPLLCPDDPYTDNLVDWFQLPSTLQTRLSEEEAELIRASQQDFGLQQLLTLTIPQHHRGNSVFCFSSRRPAGSHNHSQVMELAKNFHFVMTSKREFSRFVNAPIVASHTVKERRLLKFLMQGVPLKTIPEDSEIGQFYGEKLVKTVRAKWGNVNKTQLVYHIGAMGLDKDL